MKLSLEERLEKTLGAVSSCDADRVLIDTCAFSLDAWNDGTFDPYFSWTKHGYPNQVPSPGNAAYDQHRVIDAAKTLLQETGAELPPLIYDEVCDYTSKIVRAHRTFRDTSRRQPQDIVLRESVLYDQLEFQKEVSKRILTDVSPTDIHRKDVSRRLTDEEKEKWYSKADIDLVASAYAAKEEDESVAIITRDYDIPYLCVHADKNSLGNTATENINLVFIADSFVGAGPVDSLVTYPKIDSRMRKKFDRNHVHYSGY